MGVVTTGLIVFYSQISTYYIQTLMLTSCANPLLGTPLVPLKLGGPEPPKLCRGKRRQGDPESERSELRVLSPESTRKLPLRTHAKKASKSYTEAPHSRYTDGVYIYGKTGCSKSTNLYDFICSNKKML